MSKSRALPIGSISRQAERGWASVPPAPGSPIASSFRNLLVEALQAVQNEDGIDELLHAALRRANLLGMPGTQRHLLFFVDSSLLAEIRDRFGAAAARAVIQRIHACLDDEEFPEGPEGEDPLISGGRTATHTTREDAIVTGQRRRDLHAAAHGKVPTTRVSTAVRFSPPREEAQG